MPDGGFGKFSLLPDTTEDIQRFEIEVRANQGYEKVREYYGVYHTKLHAHELNQFKYYTISRNRLLVLLT